MNFENVRLSYGIQTKLLILSSGYQPLLSYDNSSIQKVQAKNYHLYLTTSFGLLTSMLRLLSKP